MKAIAVHPGKADSIHLEDVSKPSVEQIPDGRGVLVRVLRVGVDGTDKEINAAEYYVEDSNFVFALPETLREVGVLLEPTTVAEKGINHAYEIQRRLKVWEPRKALILGSGTIGLLMAMAARLRGLELTVASLPKPPYRNSELVEQLGAVYRSTQDSDLRAISEERGPFDLIMDATGFSPIIWQAAEVLGKNGVLVLSSITGGDRKVEINSDKINQSFVLGNKVMVGTVNASPADFRSGVDDLIKAQALFPGWLDQLLTTPIHGLENYEEMIRALTEDADAIKVFVEVNGSR